MEFEDMSPFRLSDKRRSWLAQPPPPTPPPPPEVVVHPLYIEAMEGYIHIVVDPITRRCAIVDPRVRHFEVPWENFPEDIMVVCIDKNHLKPRWILETAAESEQSDNMKRRLCGFTDEPDMHKRAVGEVEMGNLKIQCMHLANRKVYRISDCVFGIHSLVAMSIDKKVLSIDEARAIYDARKAILVMPEDTKVYMDTFDICPADEPRIAFETVSKLRESPYNTDFDTFFAMWNNSCIVWPERKWWERFLGIKRRRRGGPYGEKQYRMPRTWEEQHQPW